MRERPILMNGDMVRAILAGTKTQTRRPVKPQPAYPDAFDECTFVPGDGLVDIYLPGATLPAHRRYCPFGQPGDRLWVREPGRVCHARGMHDEWLVRVRYAADNSVSKPITMPTRLLPNDYLPRWATHLQGIPNGIFREAARIFLEIVNVRVERLEDITIANAQAEGFSGHGAIIPFIQTWERIYGSRGFGCDAKPWVWVVEFKRAAATEASA